MDAACTPEGYRQAHPIEVVSQDDWQQRDQINNIALPDSESNVVRSCSCKNCCHMPLLTGCNPTA